MLAKVPGNLNLDSFCEVALIFLSNSAVRLWQNKVIKTMTDKFFWKCIFYATSYN